MLDPEVCKKRYEKGTISCFEKLHQDVKKAVGNYERSVCGLDRYLQECLWLENLKNSKEMGFVNSDIKFVGSKVPVLKWVIWAWYAYIQQIAYFLIGIIFAIMSFMLVLGEMTIQGVWQKPGEEHGDTLVKVFFLNTNVMSTNIAILFPLAYMCACTFYGLFKIKIIGLYSLNANKQTDAFSMVFCSTIITRLIPVLCYNFL